MELFEVGVVLGWSGLKLGHFELQPQDEYVWVCLVEKFEGGISCSVRVPA